MASPTDGSPLRRADKGVADVQYADDLTQAAADLSDPATGLRAVVALRRLLDALEAQQVAAAVERGWSYGEVGAALGVTKQAISKRYGKRLKRAEREGRALSAYMDALVEITAELLSAAGNEAARLGHERLGPEHLLLGVLAQGGPAAETVAAHGVTLDAARGAVRETDRAQLAAVGIAAPEPVSGLPLEAGDLRWPAALDGYVKRADRLRKARRDPRLRSQHVLEALLEDDTSACAALLRGLGADVAALRARLAALPLPAAPADRAPAGQCFSPVAPAAVWPLWLTPRTSRAGIPPSGSNGWREPAGRAPALARARPRGAPAARRAPGGALRAGPGDRMANGADAQRRRTPAHGPRRAASCGRARAGAERNPHPRRLHRARSLVGEAAAATALPSGREGRAGRWARALAAAAQNS